MKTTIPLEHEDIALLARLAFAWDITPQQALRRCLNEAVAAIETPAQQ